MTTITASQRTDAAKAVQIGNKYAIKDKIADAIESGRKLAPLSAARAILECGWYWISAENVPTSAGYYRDNKDGTFTKVSGMIQVPWEDTLYVSRPAALAAAGAGPLALRVGGHGGRLVVLSDTSFGERAQVATVAQTTSTTAQKNVVNSVAVPSEQFSAAQAEVRALVASGVINPDSVKALSAVFRE